MDISSMPLNSKQGNRNSCYRETTMV